MIRDAALTTKEVARFLHVSHQMVSNLIKTKELPAFRVGSSVRVLYSDLLEYVHNRKAVFSTQARDLENLNDSLFTVSSVFVRTGNFRLENISFNLPRGKIMALLGPSGSGKTMLLRAIAGLEPLEAGSVYLGMSRFDDLTPEQRKIGFVYQDYALFPHLNSRSNIAFPIQSPFSSRDRLDERVAEVVSELRIAEAYLSRFPKQLPEGIKQLVAIGRERIHAMELFIMDEPLTHLDAHIRSAMRSFIKQIVARLGKTTIIAVNSPEDALALSDYTGILHKGRLIQFGPTRDLYSHPHSSMAMDALSPLGVNYVLVEVEAGATEPYGIPCTVPDGIYVLAFRPEEVDLSDGGITVAVDRTAFYDGSRVIAFCRTQEGRAITAVVPRQSLRPEGRGEAPGSPGESNGVNRPFRSEDGAAGVDLVGEGAPRELTLMPTAPVFFS